MTLLKPCLDCGELSDKTRCPEHDGPTPGRKHQVKKNPKDRGYDKEWRRLSKKAIKLQPWCLWCKHTGSRDNPLTADHLRWPAKSLEDVQVLCRVCNSRKGKVRSLGD